MPTSIYTRATETTPYDSTETQKIYDLLTVAGTGGAGNQQQTNTTDGGTEIRGTATLAGFPKLTFYSERLAAEATISGEITCTVAAKWDVAGVNATWRFRIYKVTAGGSEVETLIAEGDSTSTPTTTQTTYTFTATPPVAVTVAPEERLILRTWAIPAPSLTMGVGIMGMYINGTAASNGETKLTFTETLTFQPNKTTLYPRRTTTIGIGGFKDLLPTIGADAFLEATTRVQSSESQWTDGLDGTAAVNISAAAIADTGNAAAYTSASFTPAVNKLYLLAVLHSDAAPEATIPTITTTTGLTFVEIATVAFDTIASNLHRLTLFRALKTSGLSAGTYTVNLADAGTGCCAHLTQVSDVLTTGTDGADAVRNIVTDSANAGANPSITLAAFADSRNGTYACFGSDIATAPTAGTGFTTLLANTYSTPATGLYTEANWQNDTTADCTLASSDWGGIALELVAGAAAPVLEWISPRFKNGFTLRAVSGSWTSTIRAFESNAAANVTPRLKLARWRSGTETDFLNIKHATQEVSTIITSINISDVTGQLTQIDFLPDDRLVMRVFVTNAASLTLGAGHTATLRYDDTSVNTQVALLQTSQFKDEADPDDPSRITGGLTMGGVGN